MLRGLLACPDYKPQFSGHETFPLRHLWLRKAYDAVVLNGHSALFSNPDAIVRFGVGKNMALSIRHWAIACEVIRETNNGFTTGPLGDLLFGPAKCDPYCEHPATAWVIHWMLAGRGVRTTTWYWAFNYFPNVAFEREDLARPIVDFCAQRPAIRASEMTIKRDVECFIRSYLPRAGSDSAEDLSEPVLAELGLIQQVGSKTFEFRRGPKPTLPDGVFLFALVDFWAAFSPATSSIPVEAIAYEPGSPGRVFKLDEDSVAERLLRAEELTKGALLWSDTAGLRQMIRTSEIANATELLEEAYQHKKRRTTSLAVA